MCGFVSESLTAPKRTPPAKLRVKSATLSHSGGLSFRGCGGRRAEEAESGRAEKKGSPREEGAARARPATPRHAPPRPPRRPLAPRRYIWAPTRREATAVPTAAHPPHASDPDVPAAHPPRSRAPFRPGRAQLECRDRRPATAHRTTRPPAATVHGPRAPGPPLSRAASPPPPPRPPRPPRLPRQPRRPARHAARRAAPSRGAMASARPAAGSARRPTSRASGGP